MSAARPAESSAEPAAPADPGAVEALGPELAFGVGRLARLCAALAQDGPDAPYDRGRALELAELERGAQALSEDTTTAQRRGSEARDAEERARQGLRCFDLASERVALAASAIRLGAVIAPRCAGEARLELLAAALLVRAAQELAAAEALSALAPLAPSRELELRLRVLDVLRLESDATLEEVRAPQLDGPWGSPPP
jgi:hypothetical protein